MEEFLNLDDLNEVSGGVALPRYIHYVIKKGDTLQAIAKKYSADVLEIARINYIKDPNVIPAGKEIVIPNPNRK